MKAKDYLKFKIIFYEKATYNASINDNAAVGTVLCTERNQVNRF